jgi:putative tryptophan/tyrosine transport system substrate-binding protein
MIGRRDFITFLGGAAAWPRSTRAQAPRLAKIGFLSSGSLPAFAPLIAAYHDGMSVLGYVEGRNVFTRYVWADGHYDELDTLAGDLVRSGVNLIVASGGLVSAKAALKATTMIPVLFVVGFDPVELGLVANFNRPGRNATGVSLFTTELLPKRLEMLYELGSRIRTTGFLMNPGSVTADIDAKDAMDAAQRKGYQLRIYQAGNEREIDSALDSAAQQKVSALFITADPFFTSRRDQIVALAARHGIPVMYPFREHVVAGGLMSYGAELTWGYHLVGQYAARILKGEKPGDLPIQQPTKFNLVINLKTANALGLSLSPTLLAIADEVIE